jgi:hypothetical protein
VQTQTPEVVISWTVPCTDGSSSSVVVRSGQSATYCGTIHGSVSVQRGGSFTAEDARITGAVSASGASGVALCASTIGSSVSIANSSDVMIGDPDDGVCSAGNTIRGSLSISGSGPVDLADNSIHGSAAIYNNHGSVDNASVEVGANRIGGSLACSANTAGVSNGDEGPNTVSGFESGQCKGL